MPVTPRRLLAVVLAALVLTACRLDVRVETTVAADGSGEVVVVATVDQDVVAAVDGLAGSLVLDDATAAGWTVEGPTTTDQGGLTVTLRHRFATVEEAAGLLNSLGPPVSGVTMQRTAGEDEVGVSVTGSLGLPSAGWDAFADQALLTSAGGAPFGAQLAESGADPASSMAVQLSLRLPGDVTDTDGEVADGAVTWSAPLDGSSTQLSATSVLRAGGDGDGWAGTVATLALVLLVVWLVAGALLAVLVLRARRRRRSRPVRIRW